MFQIHNSKDKSELHEDVDEAATVEGMNSAIKTPKKHWYSKRRKSRHDLSALMKRVLRIRQTNDIMDVLKFFCLDFGCQHVRVECFLACGELKPPSPGIEPCNSMCCVYNGS